MNKQTNHKRVATRCTASGPLTLPCLHPALRGVRTARHRPDPYRVRNTADSDPTQTSVTPSPVSPYPNPGTISIFWISFWTVRTLSEVAQDFNGGPRWLHVHASPEGAPESPSFKLSLQGVIFEGSIPPSSGLQGAKYTLVSKQKNQLQSSFIG